MLKRTTPRLTPKRREEQMHMWKNTFKSIESRFPVFNFSPPGKLSNYKNLEMRQLLEKLNYQREVVSQCYEEFKLEKIEYRKFSTTEFCGQCMIDVSKQVTTIEELFQQKITQLKEEIDSCVFCEATANTEFAEYHVKYLETIEKEQEMSGRKLKYFTIELVISACTFNHIDYRQARVNIYHILKQHAIEYAKYYDEKRLEKQARELV